MVSQGNIWIKRDILSFSKINFSWSALHEWLQSVVLFQMRRCLKKLMDDSKHKVMTIAHLAFRPIELKKFYFNGANQRPLSSIPTTIKMYMYMRS